MFYSSDEEEGNDGNVVHPSISGSNSNLSLSPRGGEDEASVFGSVNEDPNELSPGTSRRPQSSRALAQKKALAMQEKRKMMRSGSSNIGMVVANDAPPRPSSANPKDKFFTSRADIKDLLKERSGPRQSEAEKDLQSRGISSSFDPTSPEINPEEEENDEANSNNNNSNNNAKSNDNVTANSMPKIGKSATAVEKFPLPLNKAPELDLSDMRAFMMRPAPKGSIIQCRIEREKGNDKIHNAFYVYLEDGDRFLCCARKRKKSKTSNYLISFDKSDLSRKGNNYFGKVRSNFVGTDFIFFDKGVAPEKNTSGSQDDIRQELGGVVYSSNVYGMKGPRKMRVVIPTITEDGTRTQFRPMKSNDSMIEKYKANDLKGLLVLQNKSPVWNETTKSYMLNFRNRVKQASVKNFQVVSVEDSETVLMQFGRVSGGVFSMDYSWPLNLFQAFAISLTSFDNKLACQ